VTEEINEWLQSR